MDTIAGVIELITCSLNLTKLVWLERRFCDGKLKNDAGTGQLIGKPPFRKGNRFGTWIKDLYPFKFFT